MSNFDWPTCRTVVHHLHRVAYDAVIKMSGKTFACVKHRIMHDLELANVAIRSVQHTEVDHHVCVRK